MIPVSSSPLYHIFGFDSDMSEVVGFARQIDEWMKAGGRDQIAASLKNARAAA